MAKLLLFDGHSIMNRAYYGVPDFTNSEGIHTNAIYGFLNILFKVCDTEKPDYIAVAFDVHAKTFRHEKYEEYKGTRKPMQEELRQQIPLIKDVLRSMDISVFEMAGFEADDILGTLSLDAENKGLEVTVVSGDRDLLQLASDKVKISMPKTSKGVTTVEDYYDKDVLEKYKVTPKQFIDVKALMGDSSDNIKGVAGIGEKTATNLIVTYESIDGIYEHIDELKNGRAKTNLIEGKEDAYFSRFLVTIKRDVPIDYKIDDLKIINFYTADAYEYMKRFEFKSFLQRFDFDSSEVEVNYEFAEVSDFNEVVDLIEKMKKSKELAISIIKENGESVALSLCDGSDKAYFIPFEYFVTEDMVFSSLAEIDSNKTHIVSMSVKDLLKDIDFKYKEDGVSIKDSSKSFDDVSIIAYLLDPLKNEYTYDSIANNVLGINVPAREELIGKNKIKELMYSDRDKVCKLACFESFVCAHAYKEAKKKLDELGMLKLYEDIERPLLFVLNDMEKEGIRVRREELVSYSEKLAQSIEVIEKKIYEEAGEEFNINSPKQLGVILFEKLGMPGGKKTKTGYSTNASVLEKLAADYPFVNDILEYRSLTKLKSTYADGLTNYIAEDGRIHGKFNQTVTATGRLSSNDPNLQNIPIRMELGKAIRKVFVPKDGYAFVDADYSQIELRILAHMSGDDVLIESYKEDEDIHKITASKVFNVPLDEVTKELRSRAKAVNFGIVYGISSFGLGENIGISRKEADTYIKEYFKTYPGIEEFLNHFITEAKDKGYIKTMYGRIRPVPEIKSSNFMQVKFGERIAMNSPIQGSAADIMKIAMINVYDELRKSGLDAKILVQVHDEILVECKKEDAERISKLLKDTMESAASLSVDLEVEVNTGDNWLDAH